MKKYTVTNSYTVEANGDTAQEIADTYAWLKDAVQTAYSASHTITNNDTDKKVTFVYEWTGEQE